jgi:hypothetical protein
MPSAADLQERGSQAASRLYALADQSMQQVRGLASQSAGYVQHKFNAFHETCRGLKNTTETQNWSTSTSERNSQNRDSSKNEMKNVGKRMWRNSREKRAKLLRSSHRESVKTCFSTISRGVKGRINPYASVTNNPKQLCIVHHLNLTKLSPIFRTSATNHDKRS